MLAAAGGQRPADRSRSPRRFEASIGALLIILAWMLLSMVNLGFVKMSGI